jgi:hypothetical protein
MPRGRSDDGNSGLIARGVAATSALLPDLAVDEGAAFDTR